MPRALATTLPYGPFVRDCLLFTAEEAGRHVREEVERDDPRLTGPLECAAGGQASCRLAAPPGLEVIES